VDMINLRSIIIAIVDMRIKFKLVNITYDATTIVIILNIANRLVGIMADGFSDVITLKSDQINSAPEFGSSSGTQYQLGLGAVDDRMIIFVDIERLISSRDMELIEAAEMSA
jgi:purine-binding chemotaxis protein CheW